MADVEEKAVENNQELGSITIIEVEKGRWELNTKNVLNPEIIVYLLQTFLKKAELTIILTEVEKTIQRSMTEIQKPKIINPITVPKLSLL